MVKTCTKCGLEKSTDEFFFKNKEKGKLHSFCKACKRIVDKNVYLCSDTRRDKMRINARASIKRAKQFVRRIRRLARCRKCGDSRWYVLEFHHLRDKKWNISALITRGAGIERIKKEIRKCEILCANCHKEEHYLIRGEEANSVEARL